ncbi:SRPBCC family protein [Mycobacterium szulgai]|uniref:ATPase n=1 Tax=Mycobacterium szulgai TaxID=1787 RepID=A0A1X2EEE5_MYCSZ|nr:SRPBCC family protein [Mycobacterium szulgai]MCV7078298.1 SRPBCC family protein [Mycobacterium szulgai]ORW99336.1 ATPase [Mycobacterium szulgai]
MTTVDVVSDIVIDRPRHHVAGYSSDPDNATAWYVNIKAGQWKSPRPARVGSRFAFVARFLGRELSYTYEVLDLQPDTRFVMRTTDGPFPMETTYLWEDGPNGATKMTLRNRGAPSGFTAIAAPVLAKAIKRANVKDLVRLKAILEAAD